MRAATGTINRQIVQDFYADHKSTICKHFNTLDVMIYDTTSRHAFFTRGPGCLRAYQRFGFADESHSP